MPRPLTYGQGSITNRERKNKNGSVYKWYEARWLNEYGKRHTKICKTKEEARNVLSQFNKRSTKNTSRKEYKTFGSIMEWYNTFGNKNAGIDRNKLNLCQLARVPKSIMAKPLTQIFAQELQEHLDDVETRYGGNPKWWTALLFKGFLKYSFEQGHIKKNVGASLIAEQPTSPERNILPRELETQFLSFFAPKYNAPMDYRPYVIGLLNTGCRIEEYFTIGRYEDTQPFEQDGIKYLRSRETKSIREKHRKQGIFYFIREFPLLPALEDYEFPVPELTHDRLQYNFRQASKKLGLKLTPHDMRHTFVTRCDELGINPTASMSWVGHKNEKTHRRYKHKTKEILVEAVEKLRNSTPVSTPVCSKVEQEKCA